MSNDFYNYSSPLSKNTLARAEDVNAIGQGIAAGFAKLPSEVSLQRGANTFAVDTGAADAYVVSMPKTWTELSDGGSVRFRVGSGNTNTGAATINVDGLGVRSIKRMDGTDVVAGDLAAGRVYELVYDLSNTYFRLLSYVSTDQASINTVASNITDVNTVATDIADVSTLAGISGNVTTVAGISANVTTVAGISSAVSTVSGISTDVSTVAADGVDIGVVAGISADIQTLADVQDGTVATSAISTLAPISANITTVAGISANVTTVAGISADVTATASVSADIATLADIQDGTVATNAITTAASNATNIGTVAGIDTNVTTVAGISGNVTTVAGISANVTTVAGVSTDVTTAAGISADISTVAGVSANVTTVATDITNVNAVATNIADVNTFANRYRIAASAPGTSLDAGDLYFNTTDNQLYVYDGSAWSAAALDANGALLESNVISQAEAEAGTATTPRAFTAERIAQAIAALAAGGASELNELSDAISTGSGTSKTLALVGGNGTLGPGAIVIGADSGDTEVANGSIVIGRITGENISGIFNTVIGGSLFDGSAEVSGNYNVFIGNAFGISQNVTGGQNIGIGRSVYNALTSGDENVSIGVNTGQSLTTGQYNLLLGKDAGRFLTTGSNNTILGYNASPSSNTVSNEFTLGSAFVTTLRCQQTSITSLSDARFKENVVDVRSEFGLDLIERVRVVEFDWNEREEGLAGKHQVGVIAQEMAAIEDDLGADFLKLTHRANPERLEAAPGELLLPLIKAVQELSARVKELEAAQ